MALVYDRVVREIPSRIRPANTISFTSSFLNSTDDEVHQLGAVELEDPFGGSKTISAAGGGSISWNIGSSVVFADAGSTFRMGLQDVSTTTNPGQGDGTFDVYKDMVGGTDTFTASSINDIVMGTGTKTLSQGDLVAVAAHAVSRAGSDSVRIDAISSFRGYTHNFPAFTTSASGASFLRVSATPSAVITFDDGTKGVLSFSTPGVYNSGLQAFNVSTGTADEYGNIVVTDAPQYLVGFAYSSYPSSTSGDFEFVVYTDPLGTPAVFHSETVDLTVSAAGAFNSAEFKWAMDTPLKLPAGTYAVTIRPTTANNMNVGYWDVSEAIHMDLYGPAGCYAVRRLDNTGAFTDYNSGTAKTRRMEICMLTSGSNTDAGRASTHIGI